MGRPRSVSDNDQAPAVSVRLPHRVLNRVEQWAAEKGVKRSDLIREIVSKAIAARCLAKRKK